MVNKRPCDLALENLNFCVNNIFKIVGLEHLGISGDPSIIVHFLFGNTATCRCHVPFQRSQHRKQSRRRADTKKGQAACGSTFPTWSTAPSPNKLWYFNSCLNRQFIDNKNLSSKLYRDFECLGMPDR